MNLNDYTCVLAHQTFVSKENLVSAIWKGFLLPPETQPSSALHISKEDIIHDYQGKVKMYYSLQPEYLKTLFCLSLGSGLISVN